MKKGIIGENTGEISFTDDEKALIFNIARQSIFAGFEENKFNLPDESDMPPGLLKNFGAFVTLKLDGKLKGCIGRFVSSEPLYKVVKASAFSSAYEDTRFPSLEKEEFYNIEIEVTVLGPLKKISDINEIEIGRHGLLVKKDTRSGTLLPQVAVERGWTSEQFLGYTSRDKAGLGWDGWRDAELYVYEGIVLKE